jgi:hypothetical protein
MSAGDGQDNARARRAPPGAAARASRPAPPRRGGPVHESRRPHVDRRRGRSRPRARPLDRLQRGAALREEHEPVAGPDAAARRDRGVPARARLLRPELRPRARELPRQSRRRRPAGPRAVARGVPGRDAPGAVAGHPVHGPPPRQPSRRGSRARHRAPRREPRRGPREAARSRSRDSPRDDGGPGGLPRRDVRRARRDHRPLPVRGLARGLLRHVPRVRRRVRPPDGARVRAYVRGVRPDPRARPPQGVSPERFQAGARKQGRPARPHRRGEDRACGVHAPRQRRALHRPPDDPRDPQGGR